VERGVDELLQLQCIVGQQTAPISSDTMDDNGLSTSTSIFDESTTTGADFGGIGGLLQEMSNADFGGSATILCRSNRRLSFTDIASPTRPLLPLKIEQYAQVI